MRALTEKVHSVFVYQSTWTETQKALLKEIFQQVQTYGSLRFKAIVSDHGSTSLAAMYIGFGSKIPTNLGLGKESILDNYTKLTELS